ncbi:SRPBCC family protein [Geodermatophilus sp. SYSU D00804]
MASVRKQVHLDAPPERVWDAVRGVGALHERLVPGFVVDTRLEDDARVVTFADGTVQREPLVDVDDDRRRLVHTAVDSPLGATHHNASVEVLPDGAGTRLEWVVDVLPHGVRDRLDRAMEAGAATMRAAIDRRPS